MGKLQTAVTLPKRILLQGWALSSFGENINGAYTFQNTPSLGSQVTYLPDNQGDGIYAICFFGTFWVIREIGDVTQEWRVITTNKALPLNNWVQVSSQGPAGTITILENISGKNNKISIKKQNLSTLIPFQIGIDVYSNNRYIFKSATTNLLGTVFNPSLFNAPYQDILNIYTPNGEQLTFYFDGSEWIYSDFSPNANNYVIPNNSIIEITTSDIASVPIGGGAIVQRYNSEKITIKRNNLFTCPFNINPITCPSVGFSDSGWGLGGNLYLIGTTTAPDNSNSAIIYESAYSPNSYVSQGFFKYWAPYTRYEFSIWTKLIAGEAAEGNIMNITRNGGPDRVALPAIGNLTFTWQKFTITFTTGGSASSYVTAFFAENFQEGTQIAVWGAEMYINK